MVADPGSMPIPADYTRPGMTETANDRPAEDAPKASVPPSPGRRNRLAAADARSQRILILVLRAIFVVVLISVVVLTVASNRTSALDFGFSTVVGLLISAAALGLIIITVDALTPNKRLAWVVGIFVGIMIGLVGAVAVGSVIDLVAGAWDLKESSAVYLGLVKVTIGIVLVYLSVSVVLTTRDDLRLVIPYVEFAKQVRGARPLLLDTSHLSAQAKNLALGFKQSLGLLLARVGRHRLAPLVKTVGRNPQPGGNVGHGVPPLGDLFDCLFLEFRGKPRCSHLTASYAQRIGQACLPHWG